MINCIKGFTQVQKEGEIKAAFTRDRRLSLVFTRVLVDLVRIGSAVWYQMGPLMKVIPYGTVPFQFQTSPV